MSKFEFDLVRYTETTQDGMLAVDNNTIVYSNERIRSLLGCTYRDLEDISLPDIFYINERDKIVERTKGKFEDITGRYELHIKVDNSNDFPAEVTFINGSRDGKALKYILIRKISHHDRMVRNIKRHEIAEREIIDADGKYRELIENAGDAILLGSIDGHIIDANKRAEEYLGYSRDELLQKTAYDIHPEEDQETVQAAFNDLRKQGKSLYDHLVKHKDGSITNAEVAATLLNYQGGKAVMAVFRDTTSRIRAENKRLLEAKIQRDTLVREVHHRIKNNLQGVAGLLRQHAMKRPELSDILDGIIGQINSMAIIHGLFGHNASNDIVLCELVTSICNEVRAITGRTVKPDLRIEVIHPVRVISNEAVPIALILNELVFNAIKHNNNDEEPIHVTVLFDGESAHVRIMNSGSELPDGFDFNRQLRLGTGLSLIKSLMPNNGCKLRIENREPGVVAILSLTHPVIIPH